MQSEHATGRLSWALAAELGVADKVAFHGFLDMKQLVELSRSAHFFVHPSQTAQDGNREGVPNSMLEAMCTGLPVLATRHGGIPEAIEDGVSGRLVGEGDANGLASAAIELMAEPAGYRAMSLAARASIDEEFGLVETIGRLEGFYREAIELARESGK